MLHPRAFVMRTAKAFRQTVRENRAYRGDLLAKKFNMEYSCPPLSEADRKEIDKYWSQYHVRFEDYEWHRMYYAVTGLHDPRFLPQPMAEHVLYPFYNRQDFANAYANKAMFPSYLPRLHFPDTIGKRMNAYYYDADGRCYGENVTDELVDSMYAAFSEKSSGQNHDIIIKESMGSFQGKGVQKKQIFTKDSLRDCLLGIQSDNYVVQTMIQQHPFFAQMNQDSVNIMRITTWLSHGKVYVFSPCIRFGIPGAHTDVSIQNGIEIVNAIKINPGGLISDSYFTLDGKANPLPQLQSKQIPDWDNVMRCVTEGALQMPYFRVIGWDITIDNHQEAICIEYNLKTPGTVIYQYAHGPFAGEHTDSFLAFLKDAENIQYIPKCIRKE